MYSHVYDCARQNILRGNCLRCHISYTLFHIEWVVILNSLLQRYVYLIAIFRYSAMAVPRGAGKGRGRERGRRRGRERERERGREGRGRGRE